MNDLHGYVVLWRIYDYKKYMLWHYGASGRDLFAKKSGTSSLIICKTRLNLTRAAEKYNITVDKKAQVIDMSRVFISLDMLESDKFLSKQIAKILLEAWNGLDDLAYSIGDILFGRSSWAKCNKKLYKKIFYANELPSITPAGKHFNVILSNKEIEFMKNLLVKQGVRILKKSGIIILKPGAAPNTVQTRTTGTG